jgi:hypothetical protein
MQMGRRLSGGRRIGVTLEFSVPEVATLSLAVGIVVLSRQSGF